MNEFWIYWLFFLSVFVLGTLPLGTWLSETLKKRHRKFRDLSANQVSFFQRMVLSLRPEGAGFFVDVLKGALLVFLGTPGGISLLSSISTTELQGFPGDLEWPVALVVLISHSYSPWRRFEGGNGMSIALGTLTILAPLSAMAGIVACGLAFLSTREIPISSLLGLLAAVVFYLMFYPYIPNIWAGGVMILILLVRQENEIDLILKRQGLNS